MALDLRAPPDGQVSGSGRHLLQAVRMVAALGALEGIDGHTKYSGRISVGPICDREGRFQCANGFDGPGITRGRLHKLPASPSVVPAWKPLRPRGAPRSAQLRGARTGRRDDRGPWLRPWRRRQAPPCSRNRPIPKAGAGSRIFG